jgi:hypothetical protein
MLPLIGLAATLVPDLIRLIAGDKAGTIADTVSRTVTDVTKTADPVAALQAIQANGAAAANCARGWRRSRWMRRRPRTPRPTSSGWPI